MAQKGKKKPSEGDRPHRKGNKANKASKQDREGSGSADWAPGLEIVPGESEPSLDVDEEDMREDVLKGRGMPTNSQNLPLAARERPPQSHPDPARESSRSGSGTLLPGSGFLDALFLDFPFPAHMEAVACHLAQEAHLHGGPAETFHDLVIQLDQTLFKDIQDLKSALGDRFAWEAAHGRPGGGSHGR